MTAFKHLRTASLTLLLLAPSAFAKDSDHVKVFITAEQPSVAEYVYAQRETRSANPTRQQQTTHAAALGREQNDLSRRMAPFIEKEHSRLRVALNGFRVSVNASTLSACVRFPA